MTKAPFAKAAQTPEQLLSKLEERGLAIPDASIALAYLRGVGAYRLKGYWFHRLDPASKRFPVGFSFQDVIDRCELDRELRAATIEAIDRLEVAIRSAIANYLSLKHSPHWFLDSKVFKPNSKWGMGQLIKKIEEEVGRSNGKRFVKHYFEKHDEPYLPPSWSVSECVTFGFWSRTFSILRDPNDKKAIAKKFAVDQAEVFQSWIHVLTVVRNIAAHHGQLLNVQLGVAPTFYKAANIKFTDSKTFFAAATVVHYLLQQTGLPNRWKSDLLATFSRYPTVSISDLGFPINRDWQFEAGWNQ